uniref:RNA-binding protein lark n=1 Tax=Lygus hesperus TaxID=30085 RepID=A0A0A9X4J2_LYGHE
MPAKSNKTTAAASTSGSGVSKAANKPVNKSANKTAVHKTVTKAASSVKAAPKPTVSKTSTGKAAAGAKTAASAAPAAKAAARQPPSSMGVYVKHWGNGSAEEAAAVFKAAGNVVKTQIRRHRYALVFFDTPAAVKKAIDLFNGKEVCGATIEVAPAKTTPKPDPHENSSCVFISPIFRTSTTKQQILELFQGMKVLRLRTYRRNFANVYLDSPAAAEKFVKEKNGMEFRNHTLRVKLSSKSLAKLKARQESAKLLMAAHRHKKTKQQK